MHSHTNSNNSTIHCVEMNFQMVSLSLKSVSAQTTGTCGVSIHGKIDD